MSELYLGLLHYPVRNKSGQIITTSVTNLDLHDISRLCATYELPRYYVIQPDESQQRLVQEIAGFWRMPESRQYNPDRYEAFKRLIVLPSLEAALADIAAKGRRPQLVVTDAKQQPDTTSFAQMRQRLNADDDCGYLLLFGTGWGLAESVLAQAQYTLPPIMGRGAYNHLSVRSAAAIIVDRLVGEIY